MSTDMILREEERLGIFDVSDIIVPRILLMQAMSPQVTNAQAQMGEIRDSIDGALLGNEKHPLDIVICHRFKTISVMKGDKGEEFGGILPGTPENWMLPYEENEEQPDGGFVKIQRRKTYNYYVLPLELDGEGLPFLISLSRTGTTTAKIINTKILQEQYKHHPMWTIAFQLSPVRETNDKKQVFFSYKVKHTGAADKKISDIAESWNQMLTGRELEVKVGGDGTGDEA